ncbi:MAG: hypothetical protein H6R01_711 [Burkholderiaceae bacterium]|nr:hypothetical protein [Burkholderiaceae bacterium]
MKKILFSLAVLFSANALAQPVPPPPPQNHYYRHGLHNDRYPAHLYYYHPAERRYYRRVYIRSHRHARCMDGVVRPASPSACRYHGGVRYFW